MEQKAIWGLELPTTANPNHSKATFSVAPSPKTVAQMPKAFLTKFQQTPAAWEASQHVPLVTRD